MTTAAASSTVEALMLSLRSRGTAALIEPDCQRRLSELNEQQLREVAIRLQKLNPEIAPAWRAEQVDTLFETKRTPEQIADDAAARYLRKPAQEPIDLEPAPDDEWQPPQEIPDEPRKEAPAAKQEPLQWLDMSRWDGEPVPERKWTIKDRVPLNQAGLFSGEGGTGKSITELQKDVAHVAGEDWLGSMPEHGPAFYIGAEDDKDEIHIRLAAIAKHYGATFEDLIAGGLHVLGLLGLDATLCHVAGKSGRVETTKLYRQLYEAAGDIKPKNISIDTLSRAFAGNEIDRVQVYAFAMHMQALAMVASGSVTVLSHPSLAGIASGSGISGSTAWHGAFRFRQYLTGPRTEPGEQPDSDVRELQFKKNQYGPTGETIVLRYQHGLFLPQSGLSSLDSMARAQRAEDTFMTLLAR